MGKVKLENIVNINIDPINLIFYAEALDLKGECRISEILPLVTGSTKVEIIKSFFYQGLSKALGITLPEIKTKLQDYSTELQDYLDKISEDK